MHPRRFDALARLAAHRLSRRAALASGGTAALAIAGLRPATAQDATSATPDASLAAPETGFGQEFLFVQTATAGSLVPNPAGTPAADGTSTPGAGADYLLTLRGHPGGTVYFSDRPARVFGDAPTQQFLDGLGFPPDNPPNAALVAQTDAGEDVVVVELFAPAYDAAERTVTYGANVLSDYARDGLAHVAAQDTIAELPASFTRASLFIDDCPTIETCWKGAWISVAPVPEGPYQTCWVWSELKCQPCDRGATMDSLATLCNDYHFDCDGSCFVQVAGV